MPSIRVEIGHNVRAWTTFTIEDATPEEIETLGALGTEAAVAKLRELYQSERAVPDTSNTTYEDNAPFFDAAAEADVIDLEED